MELEVIKNLLLNSKFTPYIQDRRPPYVAYVRGGSAVVGLDDDGSDYDMIGYTLGFPAFLLEGVFLNKKTGEKLSVLYQNVFINEHLIENPAKEFYFLFLLAATPEDQIIFNPKYKEAFLKFHKLCQKYEHLFKVCFCTKLFSIYTDFINNNWLNYHSFKYLYFWVYFYSIDLNLPLNEVLIKKLKRLKVISLDDLTEEEQQYFLTVGNYITTNYLWSFEKTQEVYNNLIKEFKEIIWE